MALLYNKLLLELHVMQTSITAVVNYQNIYNCLNGEREISN